MAGENRRVAAESAAHAQGLTDNLMRQGYLVDVRNNDHWVLRKKRRRGDHVVTIVIQQPSMLQHATPPPPPPAPGSTPSGPASQWGPPTGS